MNTHINTLSVVIPVYGSERIIDQLYQELTNVLSEQYSDFEIIFVEDSSPDNVWNKIVNISSKDKNVIGIQLMKNSGQGAATLCGIKEASGEVIVTMDDDLQHPPSEIKKLVDYLLSNDSLDVVIGVPKEKRHNFVRRIGSDFINRLNSIFLNKDKNLRFTGFRAIRRQAAIGLTEISTPYPALGPLIIQVTRRIENTTFNHQKRVVGRSNYSFSRIIKQTLSNFIGYSMLPLRIMAFIGGIGIVTSIILGAFYLWRYFFVGISIAGWTSLILVLVSIAGFIFFAFAILGEYILRIMQVTNSNPQYSVRKKTKFD